MQKFKKFSSLFLSICLLLTPSFNTYADSLYQNSSELVDYQDTTDTNSTNVYAQIEEDYLIIIPKVIVLDGVERTAIIEFADEQRKFKFENMTDAFFIPLTEAHFNK